MKIEVINNNAILIDGQIRIVCTGKCNDNLDYVIYTTDKYTNNCTHYETTISVPAKVNSDYGNELCG